MVVGARRELEMFKMMRCLADDAKEGGGDRKQDQENLDAIP